MTAEDRFQALSPHRRAHSERVVAVMEVLADVHHLNLAQARLAGWAHDLARELSRPQLLAEAKHLGLPYGPEEAQEPILLHGPVAAAWLRAANLGTESVWSAIRFHTTGSADLDPLGQALFIADGVEPGRVYHEREALYRLSLDNLTQGYQAALSQTLTYLRSRNITPHPHMMRALAALSRP